ncbi:MAG TPA: alternative ribosome rescue aminoacyl-tRNA hydrolase ArfB [Gammaproteobacteria bacterium]|nr:alternative ribosome rescue aminoacyl-tRNA hydrolase ArfB [Gammaproteobacteria bacterium]
MSRETQIFLSNGLMLDATEFQFSFVRSSGPGGQNVNKVASAVELRWDLRKSIYLPVGVRLRLEALAGSRVTDEGVLIIQAQRHRTQERNRADALERLIALVEQALHPPKPRKKTKPSKGSKRRRLEGKKRQGDKKRLRSRSFD